MSNPDSSVRPPRLCPSCGKPEHGSAACDFNTTLPEKRVHTVVYYPVDTWPGGPPGLLWGEDAARVWHEGREQWKVERWM